jgi:hypothetical protein
MAAPLQKLTNQVRWKIPVGQFAQCLNITTLTD